MRHIIMWMICIYKGINLRVQTMRLRCMWRNSFLSIAENILPIMMRDIFFQKNDSSPHTLGECNDVSSSINDINSFSSQVELNMMRWEQYKCKFLDGLIWQFNLRCPLDFDSNLILHHLMGQYFLNLDINRMEIAVCSSLIHDLFCWEICIVLDYSFHLLLWR